MTFCVIVVLLVGLPCLGHARRIQNSLDIPDKQEFANGGSASPSRSLDHVLRMRGGNALSRIQETSSARANVFVRESKRFSGEDKRGLQAIGMRGGKVLKGIQETSSARANVFLRESKRFSREYKRESESPSMSLDRVFRIRGGTFRPRIQESLRSEPKRFSREDKRGLRAIGQMLGQKNDLAMLGAYSDKELDAVFAGVKAQIRGEPLLKTFQADLDKGSDKLGAKWDAIREKMVQMGKVALKKAAAEPGARRTASGLVIKTLVEGSGDKPTGDEIVTIDFDSAHVDGTPLTVRGGSPLRTEMNTLQPGLQEALQLMRPGATAKLTIPHELAFGDKFNPPLIYPKSTLVLHLDLLEVEPVEEPEPSRVNTNSLTQMLSSQKPSRRLMVPSKRPFRRLMVASG